MANMQKGKRLRQRILHYLLDRERAPGSKVPELVDIAHDLGVRKEDIDDQLDILEEQGAIAANRTFGGNAAPTLKGRGKEILEELEEEADLRSESTQKQSENSTPPEGVFEWDAFISHATEDKDSFVRELAQKLVREGVRVWYDEFTLQIGDSLRRSIDKGLANSQYGIVVLSHSFFRKEWPQAELDGLVTRERNGEKVILPVWLDVEKEDVAKFSLTLADLFAAKAKEGIGKVITQLLPILSPNPPNEQNEITGRKIDTSSEERNISSKKPISPKLLSTIIYFNEENAWVNIKGEMFASLINWIDYEEVEDKGLELKFPGGSFTYIRQPYQTLTIYPDSLPLEQILEKFGKMYHKIAFVVDKQFDFGDLVRRSRGGIRSIEFLSKKTMTLKLYQGKANLTLTNEDEGSTITISISASYYAFRSSISPISYTTVLGYLEKDPPTEEFESYLRDAIR